MLPFLTVIFFPMDINLLRTATTKYHRLGGLNNLFSHSSGGWKSKIRVLAWSGSGEDPVPDLYTATFALCPYAAERKPWALHSL